VTIKIWDDQGVKEYRRRLEKVKFEKQELEKMTMELKEVIEKAMTKKEVIVKRAKGIRTINEWWDKECEQLKKEIYCFLLQLFTFFVPC
jgi:short-subunit dehydrogenase involved in D-alanine esterification of teichoic acids